MKMKGCRKPPTKVNQPPDVSEITDQGRRILLVARIIGTIVAFIYLA